MKNLFTTITLLYSISFLAQVHVAPSGNVGIGTTIPKEKLHVNGHVRGNINGALRISTGNGYLDLGPQNTNWAHIYTDRKAVIFNKDVYTTTNAFSSFNNDLLLKVSGSEKLRIRHNGNVGIGNIAPTDRLTVNGFIRTNQGIKMDGSGKRIEWKTSSWGSGFGHQIYSHDPGGKTLLKFASRHNNGSWTDAMVITSDAKVGIGSINPDSKLTVKGKIHCEEVVVDLSVPADYVFQKYYTGSAPLKQDYTMPTLKEIENFTKKNHHLPNIPSAKKIQEEGLELKEMTNLLLQKIEELTLYTIEQEKRIQLLEKQLTISKK